MSTVAPKNPTTSTTAVPMGSANRSGEVIVPLGMIKAIVALDAIALVFWALAWLLPVLSFAGLICAIVASILSCVLPCKEADDKFNNKITTVMWAHVTFGITYIVAVALAAVALTTTDTSTYNSLAITAIVFTFINLAVLITAFALSSTLLCKVNDANRRASN